MVTMIQVCHKKKQNTKGTEGRKEGRGGEGEGGGDGKKKGLKEERIKG